MDRRRTVPRETLLIVLNAFEIYFKESDTQNITYRKFSLFIEKHYKIHINYANALGDILGKLGAITSNLKLPILSTVVVQSGNELPSPGYFKMAHLHGIYTSPDNQLDIKNNSQLEKSTRKIRMEFIEKQKTLLQNLQESDFERIREEISLKYQ